MKKKKNSAVLQRIMKNKYIPVIMLIAFFSMSLFAYSLWGLDREEFPGEESNQNIRIARGISDDGWELHTFSRNQDDRYTRSGTTEGNNLSTILLSLVHNNHTILRLSNMLLTVLAIFLAFLLMKANSAPTTDSNMALILMIFSPVAIYFSMVISVISLYSVMLLGACIAIKKDIKPLVVLISFLMPLFGIPHTILFIIFTTLYSVATQNTRTLYQLIAPVLISGGIIEYFGLYFSVFNVHFYSLFNVLNTVIAEFGAIKGIGVMTIVLALIGFIMMFVERKQQIMQLCTILIIGSMIFIDYRFVFLLNLAFSMYGAYGLSVLVRREWYSEDLKKLTVFVIICGLAFTQLAYFPRIQEIEPTRGKAEALRWLQDMEDGIVLTEPGFSPFVQNIAKKGTLLNHFDHDRNIRGDIDDIFSSRELSRTRELLMRHDVDYIYLDEDIEERNWLHSNDGLLFLFRDQDNFLKIYEGEEGTRIYRFIGS